MDHYKQMERSLDRELSKYPVMLQLEHRTGVKKTNIVLALITIFFLLILLFILPDLVVILVTYLYPALMTITAIEAHDRQRDIHWLAYWVTVGAWTTIEMLTGGWVTRLIPMYALVKVVTCIWLYWPGTSGAVMVYERAIRPLALLVIDHPMIKELQRESGRMAGKASEIKTAAAREIRTSINPEIKKASDMMNAAQESKKKKSSSPTMGEESTSNTASDGKKTD